MTKPVALYYKILQYQPENLEKLNELFEVITLDNPEQDTLEILSKINVLFAPLGYMVNKEKIDACYNLKVIASNTTGHPHIDIEYATKRQIDIACLKFAQDFLKTITPTAELSWGLMIALTRNIIPANKKVLEGVWNRRLFGANKMLSSMQLGVVGLGRLGSLMVDYGLAFGMDVSYFDPYVNNHKAGVNRHNSLEKLVSNSDVVSVHVPHEAETEHMFNDTIFSKFRNGAYFINTSRGELVDWNALLKNLKNKRLGGAALDVFDGEYKQNFHNSFANHPVLQYARKNQNLILTPHIGGSTYDAWAKTEAYTIKMAENFFKKSKGRF